MDRQIPLKISRYTFVFSDKGRHYLYNTLSNALTEVDEELAALMKDAKSGKMCLPEELDESLMGLLKTLHTESCDDNLLSVRRHCNSRTAGAGEGVHGSRIKNF